MAARPLLVPVADLEPKASNGPLDLAQPCLGRVVNVDSDGRIWLTYTGAGQPVLARRLASVAISEIVEGLAQNRNAMLIFENGDPQKPVIVGLLAEDEAALPAARETSNAQAPATASVLAVVDGKRVRITAEDEIVLECGEASITLRRNGRLIIRGAYVETRARGTNRIKGGNVRIN
ncbi:MAG TPA: DUF6484 domain-containing protein [Polyangiaceae bacterium]|nr:DUF6484 domain-containing protein [Polyangiaceae bacterium]